MDSAVHVYLVSFPGQGHINPLLRLAKRLASKGLSVTFSTTQRMRNQMSTSLDHGSIRFEFFEDGYDSKPFNFEDYMTQLEIAGKESLTQVLKNHAQQGRPVSCLINNPFVPWVSDVANTLKIPNAILWIQSCACFSAYYHYYHGLVPFPTQTEPEIDVQLPSMPLLKHDEIPSFLHPINLYPFLGTAILGQYKNLSVPFCILMETFQELEPEVIDYMSKLCPIKPVGPLLDMKNTNEADLLEADDDCIRWLDSKPASSVVYISFGSVVYLKQEQIDEIAYGIKLNSELNVLWVMKPAPVELGLEPLVLPDGFLEEIGAHRSVKVVKWSPQAQVLEHPAVACFVTHCGWNSSMEAMVNGVPMVAFPQWGDQVTNAVYLVDVFGVGIRMCRGAAENKIVTRDEVDKSLREATSGPKAEEMKYNALKWKTKAKGAVMDGGSSDLNMQAFVDEVRMRSLDL